MTEVMMDDFEQYRSHLRAVAYRMLGSLSEADDAVQEAWLRYNRTDTSDVANLGGWLTTVVSRICLDQLRARTARREEPLGVHMPDPIITDPEHEAVLADSVGLALLDPEVVLRADGGATGRTVLLRGAQAVAGSAVMFAGLADIAQPVLVNGVAGVLAVAGGKPMAVMAFTVVDGRIVAIDGLND